MFGNPLFGTWVVFAGGGSERLCAGKLSAAYASTVGDRYPSRKSHPSEEIRDGRKGQQQAQAE
jgi:hypothetical protein